MSTARMDELREDWVNAWRIMSAARIAGVQADIDTAFQVFKETQRLYELECWQQKEKPYVADEELFVFHTGNGYLNNF